MPDELVQCKNHLVCDYLGCEDREPHRPSDWNGTIKTCTKHHRCEFVEGITKCIPVTKGEEDRHAGD